MKRYQGGTRAEEGIYLNVPSFRFVSLDEVRPLPLVEAGDWIRMPDLLLLLGAPLIGLAYVIFLPVIGFVMLVGVTLEGAAKVIVPALAPVARVLRPAWQPALAFFGRGRRKTVGKKEPQTKADSDRWVERVRSDLRDRK